MGLVSKAQLTLLFGMGGLFCTAIIMAVAWSRCSHPRGARHVLKFGCSICLTLFLCLVVPGYLVASDAVADSTWLSCGVAVAICCLCRHIGKATAVMDALRAEEGTGAPTNEF